MWPSQRPQNLLLKRESDVINSSVNQSQHNFDGNGVATSKIEIRHTRMNSPSNFNPTSNISSVNYLNSDSHRRVTFSTTAQKSAGGLNTYYGNNEPSASGVSSKSSVTGTDITIRANELAGKALIQTVCNRNSVIHGFGVDCKCPVELNEEDAKRIQELEPEQQKEEICKLMIQLVQDREKRNEELVTIQAQQKLVPTKKVTRIPRIRHIICANGRTMDGSEIPIGSFPNSFSEMKQLMDLRKDPPGFKRFTAKADMRGFLDEEISIVNEGNIFKIIGTKKKQSDQRKPAKVVTEEIYLPKGVYADTLRIGRNSNGLLIVQEPWKF